MASFLIDPHVHTSETSPCSHLSGAKTAELYAGKGYGAIIITDHYTQEYFEQPGYAPESQSLPDLPWADRLEWFLRGYHRTREAGEAFGLKVFLGIEIRLTGLLNDYLVYGLDEELLRRLPALYAFDLQGFRALASEHGAFVAQAHPFRPLCTPAEPRLLDGIEVFNGNPRHDSRDALAAAYAREHGLVGLSGSDAHQLVDIGRGGMLFPRPVPSLAEFLSDLPEARLIMASASGSPAGNRHDPDRRACLAADHLQPGSGRR